MVPDALHGGPLKQAHHFMKAQNYYDLISGMLPFRNISKNSAALHDCKKQLQRKRRPASSKK
jgi:hypothetical protein